MDSLDILESRYRREDVAKPHGKSFDWIFERTHLGFVSWLSQGHGIYLINGILGSGKSTLMKFMSRNTKILELLKLRQPSRTNIVADFYFWKSGTPL